MWVTADQVFDGEVLRSGVALRIEQNEVAEIAPAPQGATHVGAVIAPGLVDIQVNGGGGVLLNNDPSPGGVAAIIAAHRRLGSVAILPTLITDRAEVMQQATDAILATPEAIGLHLEGPHIAASKRGTHAEQHIRPLDQTTKDCVHRLVRDGKVAFTTVAPDIVSPADIADLIDLGGVVSLGHSDATAQQVSAALGAGASCGTHLYNAMSQMQGRAPAMVGGLIGSDAFVSVICDGHHVRDEMITLALRARPQPDRMMLVSDAMATVGGPDTFELYGQTIEVQAGRLVNADGNLAGAHISQAEGMARAIAKLGLSLERALRMAITVPAKAIARPDLSSLVGRAARDCVIMSNDGSYLSSLEDF
ncbi:MAG: N-acetylglucosamine-6-phosphate deacetylase [Pseudomonadota bacterium]